MLFSFITKWAIKRQLKRRQSDGFCPFGGAKRLVLMAQGKDVQSLLPGIHTIFPFVPAPFSHLYSLFPFSGPWKPEL